MAESEHKKRACDRQITKDDIDDEECSNEPEGTFEKANDETLKGRRIVKVRRNTTNPTPKMEEPVITDKAVAPTIVGGQLALPSFLQQQSAAAPAPASPAPAAAPVPAQASPAVNGTAKKEEEKKSNGDNSNNHSDNNNDKKEEAAPTESKPEIKWPPATGTSWAFGKTDSTATASTGVGFQWPILSTTTAAAASTTGTAADNKTTDAAKPQFSFGLSSGSSNAFSFSSTAAFGGFTSSFGGASAAFSASVPAFGQPGSSSSTGAFSFSFAKPPAATTTEEGGEDDGETEENPAAQVFRKEDAIVELEEVPVCTGEEDEYKVFEIPRGRLFRFAEGQWQERGLGVLRVNATKTDGKITAARIIMRGDGALGVVLNTPLFEKMVCDKAGEKAVRFMAVEADGKPCLHLIRVRDAKDADNMVQAVTDTLRSLPQ